MTVQPVTLTERVEEVRRALVLGAGRLLERLERAAVVDRCAERAVAERLQEAVAAATGTTATLRRLAFAQRDGAPDEADWAIGPMISLTPQQLLVQIWRSATDLVELTRTLPETDLRRSVAAYGRELPLETYVRAVLLCDLDEIAARLHLAADSD